MRKWNCEVRNGKNNPQSGISSFFNSQFAIRNSKFGSPGFTLIELVIFIIIAGIFLPATYVAFSSAMRQAVQPEDYTRGMLLAEQVMELATKRGYTQLSADIAAPPAGGCGNPTGTTGIGAVVPSDYACAWTPSFLSFSGSAFGSSASATSYIQISVTITTPQGNTFPATGMVTSHAF